MTKDDIAIIDPENEYERNVLIAGYQVKYIDGSGMSIIDPTAKEMQFEYAARQIYVKAYRAASAGKNSNANKNASSGLDVRA